MSHDSDKLISYIYQSLGFLIFVLGIFFYLKSTLNGPEGGLGFVLYGTFLIPAALISIVLSVKYLLDAISEYDILFPKNKKITQEQDSSRNFFNIFISTVTLCLLFALALIFAIVNTSTTSNSQSVSKESSDILHRIDEFERSEKGKVLFFSDSLLKLSSLSGQLSETTSESYHKNHRDFYEVILNIQDNKQTQGARLIEILSPKLTEESKGKLIKLYDIMLKKDSFFQNNWYYSMTFCDTDMLDPKCIFNDDVVNGVRITINTKGYQDFLNTEDGKVYNSILKDETFMSEIRNISQDPKKDKDLLEENKQLIAESVNKQLIKNEFIPTGVIFLVSFLVLLRVRKVSLIPTKPGVIFLYILLISMLYILFKTFYIQI